eukprot:CAMPEP_0178425460 /NCGR_PEP_ID=MMETSP0689_2-20121128/28734_1 /TAXON_ID=160604 /ORGANISM="Amphidinium massartii, Strain CS-259" /LENGTH=633 /DNA_ID=CAMNT_0020047123 /DNA_START=98 /DNA_END=1996 /DNA_ORIENTATION=+
MGVSEDAQTMEAMTVDKLKELLRLKGLKVSGRKQELIERLQAYEAEHKEHLATAKASSEEENAPRDEDQPAEPESTTGAVEGESEAAAEMLTSSQPKIEEDKEGEKDVAEVNEEKADGKEEKEQEETKPVDEQKESNEKLEVKEQKPVGSEEAQSPPDKQEEKEEEQGEKEEAEVENDGKKTTEESEGAEQEGKGEAPKQAGEDLSSLTSAQRVARHWQKHMEHDAPELLKADRLAMSAAYRAWTRTADLGTEQEAPPAFTEVWLELSAAKAAAKSAAKLANPRQVAQKKDEAATSKLRSEGGQDAGSLAKEEQRKERPERQERRTAGPSAPSRPGRAGASYTEDEAMAVLLDAIRYLKDKEGKSQVSESDLSEAMTRLHPAFRIVKTPFPRLATLLRHASNENWLKASEAADGNFIIQDLPKSFRSKAPSPQDMSAKATMGMLPPPGHSRGRAHLTPAKGQHWPRTDEERPTKRLRSDARSPERWSADKGREARGRSSRDELAKKSETAKNATTSRLKSDVPREGGGKKTDKRHSKAAEKQSSRGQAKAGGSSKVAKSGSARKKKEDESNTYTYESYSEEYEYYSEESSSSSSSSSTSPPPQEKRRRRNSTKEGGRRAGHSSRDHRKAKGRS